MKTLTRTTLALSLAFACVLGSSVTIGAPKTKADLVPRTEAFNSGKITVENIGKGESRATWLTIKCLAAQCPEHAGMNTYKNPKFQNAIVIKVPALKAGTSFSHNLSFWNQLSFEPGQYKFMILADAGNDIPEINELNNKAYYMKTVAKPIDSFTLKQKSTKTTIKALNTQATNAMPTANSLANGVGKADLTIKPFYQNGSLPEGYPGQSYCEQAIAGGTPKNIWFYVKNIGNVAAGPSMLKVFFNTFFVSGGQTSLVSQALPALAKGESRVMKVSLPNDCYPGNFSSSCHFRIITDTAYEVQENNEANNYIDSKCVSPAG